MWDIVAWTKVVVVDRINIFSPILGDDRMLKWASWRRRDRECVYHEQLGRWWCRKEETALISMRGDVHIEFEMCVRHGDIE